MSVLNDDRRLRYPLGVVALVLAGYLLRATVGVVIDAYIETGATWLPTLGSIGQTVSVYLLVVNLLLTAVVPAVAFYFGVRYARSA
ncbi:hypothetical protein [Halobaculum rarum]|uniref:hypothetical protein n=1 Tax=Halobaculum rarum TaxID=3075122 RepID=UPI0032AF649A